jgi:hypothetical protein
MQFPPPPGRHTPRTPLAEGFSCASQQVPTQIGGGFPVRWAHHRHPVASTGIEQQHCHGCLRPLLAQGLHRLRQGESQARKQRFECGHGARLRPGAVGEKSKPARKVSLSRVRLGAHIFRNAPYSAQQLLTRA